MNKTHSFSTKTESDLQFIENLKAKCRRENRIFSAYVVKALKAYEAAKEKQNGRKD